MYPAHLVSQANAKPFELRAHGFVCVLPAYQCRMTYLRHSTSQLIGSNALLANQNQAIDQVLMLFSEPIDRYYDEITHTQTANQVSTPLTRLFEPRTH